MKIGLYLTNQQHLDVEMTVALEEQISMVHAARDGGWDSVFSGQHYLNEGNSKQLASVCLMATLCTAEASTTVEPDAGKLHVRGCRVTGIPTVEATISDRKRRTL